jgi:carbohydrate kinase (thermoresistant glucokinase family)
MSAPSATLPIVVMGPAGCGKSTLGAALAQALDWCFIEGDALHPPANIAKMSRGEPLTDGDRAPWLESLGAALRDPRDAGVVLACSALKRAYRDRLRDLAGPLRFVLPELSREVLALRLSQRAGHYMPASLLDSQLETLEPPAADEAALRIDGRLPVHTQVERVLSAFQR